MADNLSVTAGSGSTIGMDEVVDGTLGTVKVGFGKIMDGTLDSTNKLIVTSAGAAKMDGSAVTQPISAASLPLPTGAATSAKQPALGTAGTPSTDILTVQGATSMTALKVDASATTQPVSATSLPLPTGAATSANQTNASQKTQIVDGSGNIIGSTSNALNVNISSGASSGAVAQGSTTSGQTGGLNQAAVTTSAPTYSNGQTNPLSLTTSGALRVDASATTQPVSGTVTANAGTNLNTSALALESGGNLASIKTDVDNLNLTIGSTTSGQKGNLALTATTTSAPTYTTAQSNPLSTTTAGALRVDASATTQPVSLATNTPTLQSGSTTAVTQATAANLNATVVGNGTFAVQSAGTTASGSSLTSSPLTGGGLAKTSNPTAVTDGQVVNSLHDKLGKQVVVGSVRDLKADQATTITSTTETTIITAIASTFNDLYGLIVTNTSATATEVVFRDVTAGTARFSIQVPAGDTRGFMLTESAAYKQTTVNTAWTAQLSTAVTSIKINALYVKNL